MALTMAALLALLPAFVAAQNPARTMTFDNQCSSTVYFYPTTGSAGSCAGGAACASGATCDTTSSLCFWDNPTPSLGNYAIPAGQQSVVTYPPIDGNTTWSGNYAFCADGTDCTEDVATCTSEGCRSAGPYNQAEITMLYNTVDYYDISNIGGVNVPLSFSPDVLNDDGDVYYCADAGAVQPKKSGLGASSWQFDVPAVDYNWVSNGTGTTCSASSDCSNGEVCGNVYSNGAFALQCGKLAGYWSESAVCGYGASTDYFDCQESITNGGYTGNLGEFQGCGATSGSCYQPGADEFCCGCANWNDTIGATLVPASTQGCVNQNQLWQTDILPTLQWLKAGAPNSYVFPYDDMSSTFTCANTAANSLNNQNYTITLCPSSTSFDAPAAAKREVAAPELVRKVHKGMRRL